MLGLGIVSSAQPDKFEQFRELPYDLQVHIALLAGAQARCNLAQVAKPERALVKATRKNFPHMMTPQAVETLRQRFPMHQFVGGDSIGSCSRVIQTLNGSAVCAMLSTANQGIPQAQCCLIGSHIVGQANICQVTGLPIGDLETFHASNGTLFFVEEAGEHLYGAVCDSVLAPRPVLNLLRLPALPEGCRRSFFEIDHLHGVDWPFTFSLAEVRERVCVFEAPDPNVQENEGLAQQVQDLMQSTLHICAVQEGPLTQGALVL